MAVLALLSGLFWFVGGALGILGAFVRRTGSNHIPETLTDLLAVVVGVAVLAFPEISLGVLTSILGTWIAVFGVLVVITAYRRKLARARPARDARSERAQQVRLDTVENLVQAASAAGVDGHRCAVPDG